MQNFFQGERERHWSRTSLLASVIASVIYFVAFLVLFPTAGGPISAVAVFPAVIAGLALGIRGGLLFGVVMIVGTAFLFLGFDQLESFVRGGITGNTLLIVLAIGAGWLSNLLFTVRKQSQELGKEIEERKLAEQARQATEARLRTVIDNAPVLLWNVSAERKIQVLQGSTLDKLNLDAAALVGEPVSVLYAAMPEMQAELDRTFSGEVRSVTMPAGDLSLDAHFIPIQDTAGTVIGVIGVATDVTEQQQTKVALDEAQGDLASTHRQLQRAQTFFEATIEQIEEALQRGGDVSELSIYVGQVKQEFARIQ